MKIAEQSMEADVNDSPSWYELESVLAGGKVKLIHLQLCLYIDVCAKRIRQLGFIACWCIFLLHIEILQRNKGMILK